MLSSLPVTSNLPAPTPGPGPVPAGGGNGEARPGAFSRALDEASSPEAERERQAPSGREAGPTKARNTGEGRHKVAGRAAEHPGVTPTGNQPAPAETAATEDPTLATSEDEAAAPEAPADVSTLLADLQARLPGTPQTARDAAGAAQAAATGEADTPDGKARTTALDTLRGATQQRQIDLPTPPADRRGGPATPARPEPGPVAEPPSAAAAGAAERQAASAAQLPVEALQPAAPAVPTAAPQMAAAPGAAVATVAPDKAEATIAAHPTSADFAPQLGARVATFVRDGIEHARLQLHPAELGPVQVQIQLEGNNAQVMMGAEHPLTRQALEQSLPMLAAALREAGLTLAGGGVFEQARQGQGSGAGGGRSDGSSSGRSTGDAEAPPTRAQQPRSRGVVDLVA